MAIETPVRFVCYGDPGVGKTTLALTFPRPIVIDTDFGLEGDAVKGRRVIPVGDDMPAPEDGDILVVRPSGYRSLENATKWMLANEADFDTIVLDAFDGAATILLNEVVDQGKKNGDSLRNELVPETGEYMVNQKQMERIINTWRRMPGKNIVLVGGVREPEGKKRSLNAAPGTLAIVDRWSSLIGELTVVRIGTDGNIDNQNGAPTRVLMLDPSSRRRECKTRWATLSPYVTEPTYDKLMAGITGKEESK